MMTRPRRVQRRRTKGWRIESYRNSDAVMQDDLAELLRVLNISDHARPMSPHQVMTNEAIPAVKVLKDESQALAEIVRWFTHDFVRHPDRDWCVARDRGGFVCGLDAPDRVHQTLAVIRARIAAQSVTDPPDPVTTG